MAKLIRKSKKQIEKDRVLQIIAKNKETLATTLDLSSLTIGDLPEEVWQLTHLKRLNLRFLNLEVLSPNIGNLINLERLNLDGNKFKNLPSEMKFLTKLTHLDADNNQLLELPEEIGNLKMLYHISLQNNRLIRFPVCLTEIDNLNCIHLQNNIIQNVPTEVEKLSKLQILILKNNEIEILQSPLANLKSIRTLDISNNQISHLPEDIGKLTTLINLDISYNWIDTLPTSISKLRKLNYFLYHHLPLEAMPEIKDMGMVEAFKHLELLGSIGENAVFWKVPKPLVTAFKQYLTYFSEFVKQIEQEEITFEVLSTEDGLKIITQPTQKLSIERINNLLEEFISQRKFEPGEGLTKEQQFNIKQLIRDYEFQINQLNAQIANQADRMQLLGERILSKDELIKALQLQIQFFKTHTSQILQLVPQSNTQKTEVVVQLLAPVPEIKRLDAGFDANHFLKDLLDAAVRMCERKKVHEVENLHNTNICDWLRTQGFNTYDQTLSGISNKTYGELDIMIRENNGTPINIVEGLRAKSCSQNDTNISSHIDKLLHKYDTAGHEVNYIIVYAEAERFSEFWKNYINYMKALNSNKGFTGKYQLYSFIDTKISKKADIKVGLATHEREEQLVEVYHLVIDMYCPPAKDLAPQKKAVAKKTK